MMKKFTGILFLLFFSSTVFSSAPRGVRIETVTGLWINQRHQTIQHEIPFAQIGTIRDFGSRNVPLSALKISLSDSMQSSRFEKTTSRLSLSAEATPLDVMNDGSVVEYLNEEFELKVEQHVFFGGRKLISRNVKTSGFIRMMAGGPLGTPVGSLRFSLPACPGRLAATYEMTLAGSIAPLSKPF